MAKNMQPVLKRCRTLGVSPAAMGYNKTSNKNPGGQRRAKKSEYATQLTEKQKVKFVYIFRRSSSGTTTTRPPAPRATPVRCC